MHGSRFSPTQRRSHRFTGNPLLTLDLFAREPSDFDDLWSHAETVVFGGRTIRIASLDDLLAMSRDAARPKDLLDIERLDAIASSRSADSNASHPFASAERPADFRAAEEQALESSLAATTSQRLAWLEGALTFAWEVGALHVRMKRDERREMSLHTARHFRVADDSALDASFAITPSPRRKL